MHFAGDLSKSSKWELLHLKEIPYWHRAGSGIQETFNRLRASGKKFLTDMDTDTIEVWSSTMLALALQQFEKKDFYLGRPKNDPPDMAIMTMEKGYFLSREIEVTRCRDAEDELIKNLLRKDADNNFSDKYILCGFVEVPGKYDLIALGNKLQAQLVNLKNVVLVFNGKGLADSNETINVEELKNLWTVAQISPVFSSVTIDISTEYRNWMNDSGKLIYVQDGKIYWGKRKKTDPYPTLLPDTPLT